jgi:hypothetical protein
MRFACVGVLEHALRVAKQLAAAPATKRWLQDFNNPIERGFNLFRRLPEVRRKRSVIASSLFDQCLFLGLREMSLKLRPQDVDPFKRLHDIDGFVGTDPGQN